MDDRTLYDLFGSLSREIGALRTETGDAFQRIQARLDRQIVVVNERRLDEWARRIEKLEGNKPGTNGS
jgi:hypothetical protein